MRRATVLLALLTALLWTGLAKADPPVVYITNTSTALSDAQIRNALPALQAQVDLDFGPVWGSDARLVFIREGQAPRGAYTLELNDYSDVYGALGYHDVCNRDGNGNPCAFVSAQTTLDDGDDPFGVLSHELLEMLADPYTSTFQKVGQRMYVQEVCDAPESQAFSYTRPGADGTPIPLSDFVTPMFFRPGHVGPYDFRGYVHRALQILPGGYLAWWENGAWHQKAVRHARVPVGAR